MGGCGTCQLFGGKRRKQRGGGVFDALFGDTANAGSPDTEQHGVSDLNAASEAANAAAKESAKDDEAASATAEQANANPNTLPTSAVATQGGGGSRVPPLCAMCTVRCGPCAKSRRTKSKRAKSRRTKSKRTKSKRAKSKRTKSKRAKSKRAKSKRAKSRRR